MTQLEKDVLQAAQQAIAESIKTKLTGYDSPLGKLVTEVVTSHSSELRTLINDAFEQVIRTDDFKAAIVSAFSHKIARSVISNNDGLFDKVSAELKQDSAFKAKMVLAVGKVVEEILNERKA